MFFIIIEFHCQFKGFPTAISSLKTAKKRNIEDKKLDELSDHSLHEMLLKLEKEEHGVALNRLMEPFSEKCIPQLRKTPNKPQRLTAVFDKTKVDLPIAEMQRVYEDLGYLSITQ